MDGKTSRRSHDRAEGAAPLRLVSAFAATSRLVLGQAAVPDQAGEVTAVPVLLARLADNNGLRGALASIDAVATNATAIQDAGADYLPAVKANQPTLRAEVEACFAAALPGTVMAHADHGKGHGRIEQRTTSRMREVDWLSGGRRFPGELRLPGVACIIRAAASARQHPRGSIRAAACIERSGATHVDTRCCVSSANLDAERAGQAVRGHWAVENSLHWALDVTFGGGQARLRKGYGAKNMAVVRHFALNLIRAAKDKHSIRLRRKFATWTPNHLDQLLNADVKQLGFEALRAAAPSRHRAASWPSSAAVCSFRVTATAAIEPSPKMQGDRITTPAAANRPTSQRTQLLVLCGADHECASGSLHHVVGNHGQAVDLQDALNLDE